MAFAAGGGVDSIMRRLSDDLQKALGQPIIIEPRPGANGAIGSTAAARATPDGYTLLATASSTFSLNPNLMKDPPYDQLKDLVPVATIGRSPWLLVVPTDSPFKSIDDVVKFGKANPGKLAFPFWQSSVLVTGETFGRVAGILLRKVPYKGPWNRRRTCWRAGCAIMFTDTIGARPQLDAGKIRVLGTTVEKRPSLVSGCADIQGSRLRRRDRFHDRDLRAGRPTADPSSGSTRSSRRSSAPNEDARTQAAGVRPRSDDDDAPESSMRFVRPADPLGADDRTGRHPEGLGPARRQHGDDAGCV